MSDLEAISFPPPPCHNQDAINVQFGAQEYHNSWVQGKIVIRRYIWRAHIYIPIRLPGIVQ